VALNPGEPGAILSRPASRDVEQLVGVFDLPDRTLLERTG
jgi:hypothetical protein